MKRTLATLALLAIALPAQATDCQTVTIENIEGTPFITAREGGLPRADIVGHYLNIDVLDDGTLQSVDVSGAGITGATVCTDGSVTLAYTKPEQRATGVAPEVNASQDSTPIYLTPRVQDVRAGTAV